MDYVLIADTGPTDGTADYPRRRASVGLLGEVYEKPCATLPLTFPACQSCAKRWTWTVCLQSYDKGNDARIRKIDTSERLIRIKKDHPLFQFAAISDEAEAARTAPGADAQGNYWSLDAKRSPNYEGELIEVAMVGRDSLFGASAALDRETTSVEAVVQLPGSAYVMAVGVLRLATEKSPALRATMLRHEHALFAQAIQSAACNAAHSVKARMARWLLRAHDLSGSTTLPMTQEFLGEMIGVQRSSVSAIAGTLQRAGVIAYSRGTVKIRDMEGLKGAACECYMTMKDRYDQLVAGAMVATEKPVLETVALAQPPASRPIFLIKDD